MKTFSFLAIFQAVAFLAGCDGSGGGYASMGTITVESRPATGVRYHNADLGEAQKAVYVYKLPEINNAGDTITPLMFTSSMAIDADGMGDDGIGGEILDPTYGQNDTSLHYAGSGKPLDARYVRYIVLPEGFNGQGDHPNVRLGDVAAVFYNGRLAYAIFGDAGPASQLGEGSVALADALGIPSDPEYGGVSDGVIYIIFPGSGPNPSDVLSSGEIDQIGRGQFTAAGGNPG